MGRRIELNQEGGGWWPNQLNELTPQEILRVEAKKNKNEGLVPADSGQATEDVGARSIAPRQSLKDSKDQRL